MKGERESERGGDDKRERQTDREAAMTGERERGGDD